MANDKYLNKTGLTHYDEKIKEVIQKDLAQAWSNNISYTVGALVVYKGLLYKCTAQTIGGQAWDSSKWTQVKVSDEFLRNPGIKNTTKGATDKIPVFEFDSTGNISSITEVSVASAQDGKLTINGATPASGTAPKIEFTANQSTDTTGTIDKAFVGLGNVVNTGDGDAPLSGGTTKFTTGGAYTLREQLLGEIRTQASHFRGSWDFWEDVPTDEQYYPADAEGNHEPTENDYLIVEDASAYPVESGQDPLDGVWRFVYTGQWQQDGKTGWEPAYQIEGTTNYSDLAGKPTVKFGTGAEDPVDITALQFVAGTNVTLTPDQSNYQKVTIAATDKYQTPDFNTGLKISTGSGVNNLYVPNAGVNQAGVITMGNQEFRGGKTLSDTNSNIETLYYYGGVDIWDPDEKTKTLVDNSGFVVAQGYDTTQRQDELNTYNIYTRYGNETIEIYYGEDEASNVLTLPYDSGTIALTKNIPTGFTIVANATDGIFDITGTSGTNAVTYALAPYSSETATSAWVGASANAGKFYLGTQSPALSTRLNYNGNFYSHILVASSSVTAKSGLFNDSDTGGNLYVFKGTGVGLSIYHNKITYHPSAESGTPTYEYSFPTDSGTLALTKQIPTVPTIGLTQSTSGSGTSAVTTTTWSLDTTEVAFATISDAEIDALFA